MALDPPWAMRRSWFLFPLPILSHPSGNVRLLLEMVPTSIYRGVRLNSTSFAILVAKGQRRAWGSCSVGSVKNTSQKPPSVLAWGTAGIPVDTQSWFRTGFLSHPFVLYFVKAPCVGDFPPDTWAVVRFACLAMETKVCIWPWTTPSKMDYLKNNICGFLKIELHAFFCLGNKLTYS